MKTAKEVCDKLNDPHILLEPFSLLIDEAIRNNHNNIEVYEPHYAYIPTCNLQYKCFKKFQYETEKYTKLLEDFGYKVEPITALRDSEVIYNKKYLFGFIPYKEAEIIQKPRVVRYKISFCCKESK